MFLRLTSTKKVFRVFKENKRNYRREAPENVLGVFLGFVENRRFSEVRVTPPPYKSEDVPLGGVAAISSVLTF